MQCLPFSWTTLRGKHCQHPIAIMGVVDMFGQCLFINDLTPAAVQTGQYQQPYYTDMNSIVSVFIEHWYNIFLTENQNFWVSCKYWTPWDRRRLAKPQDVGHDNGEGKTIWLSYANLVVLFNKREMKNCLLSSLSCKIAVHRLTCQKCRGVF